jgi:TonB-dependent receptor
MPKSLFSAVMAVFACALFSLMPLHAQEHRGTITGNVMDAEQGILPGAQVTLQPGGQTVVSNAQGQFTILNLAAGHYTLTVSYVGFAPYSKEMDIAAGQLVHIDAALQVESRNEVVTVRGERERGEVEAINIERTADNIIQVLPNEVITSLPNTNIADAVGRLPSVSLERDEGEGKYIQIRGTEPRLSNVTINGIHVPSPEGVRNVKLDAIPADLVDMVEINKTLSANQDADAIGGSVNLVTKSPTDKPYVTVLGMGGYTPISGGRKLYQFDGTAGQRFGNDKKFGLLFGGSYDYNARGINDIEPAYLVPGPLLPNTMDLREYLYDRTRYGFAGEADYKIGDMSSVYLRGLFSKFKDFGEQWAFTPGIDTFVSGPSDPNNTCGITTTGSNQGCGSIGLQDVNRKPGQQIFSLQAGARHAVRSILIAYEVALSQANYTGGFPRMGFGGPSNIPFVVDTRDPFVPKFVPQNGVNIYDLSQYVLGFGFTENNRILEKDAVGDISVNKQYSIGSHSSSLEVGFKGWDARKTDRTDREFYDSANGLVADQYLSAYRNNHYYFGDYIYGPVTSFSKVLAAVLSKGGGTSPDLPGNPQNTFAISERIWAGYAMNTISFGRLRLQGGVRIESTQDALRANNIDTTKNPIQVTPLVTDNSYTNVFPSVQAQYRFGSDTILRGSYGMGIARPNFGDTAPFLVYDPNGSPSVPLSAGNPNLKPTHAQNFDVLIEHYVKPLGLIQGGFFYKALTDPIYSVVTVVQSGQFAGKSEQLPENGPSAHITGIEMAWQQRLSFLPGVLNAMGVRANYSYVSSQATFPVGFGRTDHPTLVRTAPNNWNFDVTYDKKGLSARMGLTHNDGYIWSYGGSNAKDPSGDTYLYPHTQVDAQVSYWIPRGHGLQAIVSMLNLNNEVFGFYIGSEQFPIQREYYSRTVSVGLRWTLPTESK